jgi:hypothetical protein
MSIVSQCDRASRPSHTVTSPPVPPPTTTTTTRLTPHRRTVATTPPTPTPTPTPTPRPGRTEGSRRVASRASGMFFSSFYIYSTNDYLGIDCTYVRSLPPPNDDTLGSRRNTSRARYIFSLFFLMVLIFFLDYENGDDHYLWHHHHQDDRAGRGRRWVRDGDNNKNGPERRDWYRSGPRYVFF